MKQLFICWLLLEVGLACDSLVLAQRRPGQALLAWPSGARYHRSAAYRDYFRPGRRAYQYGPSRRAYFHRQAYQPHVYSHRRPIARRAPVALLQPQRLKFR